MELRRRYRARTCIVLAAAVQLITAAFGVSALLTSSSVEAAQTVPYKINFQGRLTDNSGNVLSDGAYNIKFRFFDAATVGVNKWQGDRIYGVSDNRVTVQNGLFNIQFGDTAKGDPALTTALFNTVTNGNLWLEVELPTPATATCATNGCAVFTEGAMTPRQPLAATPYALNADTVDGIDGASLVQLSPSLQQTGTINVSGTITTGGTVQGNIVDAATSGALTLGSSNATSVALAKNTTLGSGLTMTLQGTNALTLGSTTAAGGIVFQDGTVNNRTVTLNTPALGASYSLSLPNAAPGTSVCLRSGAVTASLLVWGACTSSSLDPSTLTTGSAAVTLQSAVSSALTITSGNGIIGLGSGTIQRSNAALSIDVLAASASTLTVTNSNVSNVASLDVEGGINIGSGQTYKIGTTQITSAALSNDANLTKQGGAFSGTNALLTNNTNQLVLGTTNTTTITMAALGASQILTIPNVGNSTLCTSVGTSCSGAYIQNAPGSQQSANFNIVSSAAGTTAAVIQGATSNSVPVAVIRAGTTPAASLLDIQNLSGTSLVKVDQSGNLGVGLGATAAGYPVDITGKLRSSTGYILGADLSLLPVSGGQSAMSAWWGLQLIGNKQSAVDYAVTNYGAAGDFSVIIPNQQAASIGLVVRGQTSQAGDLAQWQNVGGTALLRVSAAGVLGSADSTTATTAAVAIRSGNATVGAGLASGAVTLDAGTATGTAGGVTIAGTSASALTLGRAGLAASIPGGITTGGAAVNAGTGVVTGNGSGLTNLNPTNLVQGTGAVTLQPAAAQALNLTSTGASGITVTPGTSGLTTNLAAGIQAKFSASAIPTADLVVIGNIAGQEPTGNLINALQLNWFAKPSTGNMSSGYRVDVRNNNTVTAGQVQGVRIVATGVGGAINSDTAGLYIDALTNASTGTASENAIEIGSGWDAGFFIQSGGNAITSTLTNSALSLTQSGNPAAGAALLYARNTNGTPSGNLIDLGNNTASVFNITSTGTSTFQPTVDSQTAMTVSRSAAGGGTRLFTVDTEGTTDPIEVQVGSSSTIDAVQVNLGIDSSNVFADAGSCTTTANQGAMYYNVAASAAAQGGSNAVRACINGAWEDLISTAGLGILLFGVVADSGANPGDLPSLVTTSVSGPCKVSWVANAATSTVRLEACVAYSGGRKVTIQQNTTFAVPTNVANGYSHICLNATGGITATASNATETANLPALNVGAPLLCLADVRANAGSNGIQAIYDTRTFTNTTKEFVNTTAATSLGVAVIASGTGVALPGGATVSARGIVVASNGAASIANAPNAIIATNGPAVAKATAGTAAQFVNIAAATGYVTTAAAASATAYANLGYSRNSFPGTLCTTTANAINCNRSVFLNIALR